MTMDGSKTSGMIFILLLIPVTVVAFIVSKPNDCSRRDHQTTMSASMNTNCNEMTQESLWGKNVILTRASSGLGKSLAYQLAKCQVKTLVLSGRNVQTSDKELNTPRLTRLTSSHGKSASLKIKISMKSMSIVNLGIFSSPFHVVQWFH